MGFFFCGSSTRYCRFNHPTRTSSREIAFFHPLFSEYRRCVRYTKAFGIRKLISRVLLPFYDAFILIFFIVTCLEICIYVYTYCIFYFWLEYIFYAFFYIRYIMKIPYEKKNRILSVKRFSSNLYKCSISIPLARSISLSKNSEQILALSHSLGSLKPIGVAARR